MMKKQDLVNVIASRARAIDYWATGHYLPNPDPVLKKMGRDISAYREVLADSFVAGCVRRRKAAVKALEWRLTPSGNQAFDEALEAVFTGLPLSNIMGQILDASLFGYQALEVCWRHLNNQWLPQTIEGRPQEWFVFDEDNQLRLRTRDAYLEGQALPPYRMLLATQNASYTNPYGQGDLSLCFWASTFKKGGFKFWLEFTEKYGSPWLVGKHPRQATYNETEELLDSMEKMLGTAVAAIPDDSSIGLIEGADKSGSSEAFDSFIKYCKSEIAIAILGQNQTTEAEANRASATAGLDVLEAIRADDATLVEGVFNQLIDWIIEINDKQGITPPRFELYEQEALDLQQAERDVKLAGLGVQFSEQYLKRIYNFEEGDISLQAGQKSEKSAKVVELHEHDKPQLIAERILEQLEVEGEDLVDNWLQAVKDKLSQAESLEDFRNQLDSLIPELSFAEYGELLALGSTVAELAGRQSVVEETRAKP
ncbi:hypothetical protein A4G20_05615 [Pasteurellaceae bacterium RH1A]|nr:hypothetical protein A4G20_05615 [Pasteurellaceae bacterium RH1A]